MAIYPQRGLSLCSGIGGIELGIKAAIGPGYRTVAYVEREAHAAAVLVARMQEGALCEAPLWDDVKTFDPRPWRGAVDIITAGYPCQPFSLSGRRLGADDPRHLWPHILHQITVIQPAYVFCENVPGHISMGFDTVCQNLAQLGYRIEAGVFSAREYGAPHLRQRLFFLAYAYGGGLQSQCITIKSETKHSSVRGESTDSGGKIEGGIIARLGGHADGISERLESPWRGGWELGTPRVCQNMPMRTDRLRAMGNAVVPIVSQNAFLALFARIPKA